MIRLTVAAITLVLLAAVPVTAAPAKVALTAIDNDDGDLRTAVAEALEGPELALVGSKATNRAVDNLKAELSDMTEKQAKKLASDLEADAIVHGMLDADGKKKILRFKLFVKGKKQKGFSVQFTNARSKKFKVALKEKMVEKISIASSATMDEETPKKGKKGEKAAKPAQADDEEDPVTKKNAKKAKAEKVAKEDEPEKPTKKGKADAKKAKADKEDEDKPEKTAKKGAKTEKAEKADKEEMADKEEGGDDEEKPKKSKTVAAVDADDEDGGAAVTVRARSSSKKGAHTANRAAVRVEAGVSVAARQLVFTSTPELGDVDGEDRRPKPFKQTPVPGARVGVELYPLAFMDPNSFAAGLGAAVEFDRVLKSTATVKGGEDDGKVSQVTQQSLVVGGRYRLAFGKAPTSPSITLGLNYGRRTFKVNGGNLTDRNNLDLPDTDYKYLAPLLGFRIPFVASVALFANGEAMLVRDAGGISNANSYGRAKIFGFDTQAGLDIVVSDRLAIRLAGEFTQLGFTFTGGGELAKNRDGDPMTQDIGGALDRSVGGTVTVGGLY